MKKTYITPFAFEAPSSLSGCIMIPESLLVSDDEVDIVGSKSRDDYDEEEELEFIEMMKNSRERNGLW